MKKLNPSVTQCFNPDCHQIPTVQLDSKSDSLHYTAAQALVCAGDIEFGRNYLQTYFPGFRILEIKNPNWLSREQKLLREKETQELSPPTKTVEERHPLSKEELINYINTRYGGAGRRK